MAKKKRKTRRSAAKGIGWGLLLICIAVITVIGVRNKLEKDRLERLPIVQPELTAEAGGALPEPTAYFKELRGWEGKALQVTFTPEKPEKPGEYAVTLTADGEKERFESRLTLRDTTPPALAVKAVTLDYGKSYAPSDFVESVRDAVSGENCTVVLADQAAHTEPGKYTVTVQATDESGNVATAETALTIKEKPKPKVTAPAVPANSGQTNQNAAKPAVKNDPPYLIRVNRAANCVTVYKKGESGKYDSPVKAFVCSTGGNKTPTGTFRTTDKYVWRRLVGGVYGQYATRITGQILFHSVPYFSQNKGNLEYEEYNKLGSAASLGCVRLSCADVKWIYDNCPKGMTVEIYDDAANPGPLGKPAPTKIDLAAPERGWDPTDPDPANPWRQKREPAVEEAPDAPEEPGE